MRVDEKMTDESQYGEEKNKMPIGGTLCLGNSDDIIEVVGNISLIEWCGVRVNVHKIQFHFQ